MDITIIGTDHKTQWRDECGHFNLLLNGLLETSGMPGLIAEEALSLPTTVGFRFAMKFDIPWANVDMDHYQRNAENIDEEVPTEPTWDRSGRHGMEQRYVKRVQDVREGYWCKRLRNYQCRKVWMICGSIHVIPLSRKLRGHDVTEIRVWEEEWYRRTVGTFEIFEEGEEWTSKFFAV